MYPKFSPDVLVLADDLTGLAELACLAAERGLRGQFIPFFEAAQSARPAPVPAGEGQRLLFINLGCRALEPTRAMERVRAVLNLVDLTEARPRIYLKLDSTARGPIAAMLAGLRHRLGRVSIPICLVNPATGRSVEGGRLRVNGVPLHLTAFANDPLHPVASDDLKQLFGGSAAGEIEILDGYTPEQVAKHARIDAPDRIAAGAAPFGVELLSHWLQPESPGQTAPAAPPNVAQSLTLIGSAHPANARLVSCLTAAGAAVVDAHTALHGPPVPLPLVLIDSATAGSAAEHLQRFIAAAATLIQRLAPPLVFVSGGETALQLFTQLNVRELRPACARHPFFVLHQPGEAATPSRQYWVKPGGYNLETPLTELVC